jgi:RimJ/RimL family protein N-acetyltransferase
MLKTERLLKRDWRDAEADRVFDMYSRWEVARYLGAQPRVLEDPEQAVHVIERWRTLNADDPRFGCWAIEVAETGVVAGTALRKLLPNTDGSPPSDVEIGWHLHPDSWGNGYATEAARALAEEAFDAGTDEVFAVVYPENTASLAVCRRLGMTPLGQTDRWYGMTVEAFRLARGRKAATKAP